MGRAYARTADGLPYIGPHRNFPHHLFAFGDSSHSVTGAYLASRILLRHHPRRARAGRRGASGSTAYGHGRLISLVFGPHPDDLEIGLGGTIARHAALGLQRRPVRSDGRRDGQQRHGRGAAGRGRGGARACSARRGARTCAGPIGGSARIPAHLDEAVAFIRRHRPRVVAVPYWSDRHPDHVGRERGADRSGVQRRPAAVSGRRARRGRPSGSATTSSTTASPPSFVVDVSEHYDRKRAGARLPCQPVPARGDRTPSATRLNTPLFRQLIESRDAQFGALAGVPLGRRASSCASRCVRRRRLIREADGR